MYDLAVLGGGPAGSSAAITAARMGARVVLLERGEFPRQKVCGEFVSAESLSLLASLLGKGSGTLLQHAIHIHRARIFMDGRTISADITPPAASIARLDLDVALWQAARDAGVDARAESPVVGWSGNGPFHITCPEEEFRAEAVINAAGRWSNLDRGQINRQSFSEKWIGVKAHFREKNSENSVDLYFFEGGYCGVQPVKMVEAGIAQQINASAMVRASVATSLPQVFAQHPALQRRSESWQLLGEPVTTSPLLFRAPRCATGKILRVGDAAGFVDPFVGDGISLALRSGTLAAQSLSSFFMKSSTLDEAIAQYRKTYEANLSSVFRNSSQLRRLARLPRALRLPILYIVSKTPPIGKWMVQRTR